MASNTNTAAGTAATPTAAATGPYRNHTAWATAHAAAVQAHRANPTAKAALQVATHLAWRAPGGSVAWHKGTNAAMVAHAATLGITPGTPVHKGMAAVVAALPAGHAATKALAAATKALAPA